jgi:hypothetical protein
LDEHRGTQRLPNPGANPAQGSPGTDTLATSWFVAGSILWMAFGPVLPTQTASAVMATQSAVLPIWIVAMGLSSLIGLGSACAAYTSLPLASAIRNPTIARRVEDFHMMLFVYTRKK